MRLWLDQFNWPDRFGQINQVVHVLESALEAGFAFENFLSGSGESNDEGALLQDIYES